MKEQMTEKKKLEDVTEVQMKYQKEIEAIVRGMSCMTDFWIIMRMILRRRSKT